MDIETWVGFATASIVILLIPGPTVLMVASYTLLRGKKAMMAALSGVILGDFIAMSLALIGVGTLLALSSQLFIALKWIGALYLIYLGIKLLRSKPVDLTPKQANETNNSSNTTQSRVFWDCFLATLLNPKSIIFFTSFLPQFISPEYNLLGQFSIMVTTFVSLAGINVVCWVLSLDYAKSRFQENFILKNLHRIGGALLISTGILALASKSK